MNLTHNKSNTKLYQVWRNIKAVCSTPSATHYQDYGARGITVCSAWENSFMVFCNWCHDNGYIESDDLELSRKDKNLGFTHDNCEFITHAQNSLNTRRSKIWYVNGKPYDGIRAVCEAFSISQSTVRGWCDGYKSKGKTYPPKPNCWSEFKYPQEET